MAYGTVKVNFITFDTGSGDQTIPVADLNTALTSGITVTGAINAQSITAVSGTLTTLSGNTGRINTLTGTSLSYSSGVISNLSGTFVQYASGEITSVSGNLTSYVSGNITNLSGNFLQYTSGQVTTLSGGNFIGPLTGNAATATKLVAAQNFTVTGDTLGTVNTDLASGFVINTVFASGSIVNEDISAAANIADTKLDTISTAGKVSNSATTATSVNTASAIVARDGSGNFSAGTIIANISGDCTGNAGTATKLSSARNFTVTGDINGTVSSDLTSGFSVNTAITAGSIVNDDINASAGIVDTKLATISTAGKVANTATTATSANIASAIIARDGLGNFSAGVITATLSGNAATATKLSSQRTFEVTGDITGTVSSDLTSGASISTAITSGVIVNDDVNASAAIAGTKISPNFGSQAVVTTGTITGASLIPSSATVPTNGVYLPAANSVAISTNGTGRLFVDSAGLVGIGTSTPETLLHVKSTSQFDETDASQTAGILVEQSGGTAANGAYSTAITLSKINSSLPGGAIASVQTSDDVDQLGLAFLTHSGTTTNSTLGEALRITHDGKVGIGTANPQSELVVRGSTPQITFEPTADTQTCRLQFALTDETIQSTIQGGGVLGSVMTFNQGSFERARIDSSGRLLVGTSTSVNTGTNAGASIQINSTSGLAVRRNSADAFPSNITLGKSRNATDGSYAIVNSSDGIGSIRFAADDGTDLLTQAASIEAYVDGTPGLNDMPGRLVFSTTADGASSPTERMRIDSNGDVQLAGGANLKVNASSGSGYASLSTAVSNGSLSLNASNGVNASTFLDFDAPDISAAGGQITYRFGRATTVESGQIGRLHIYAHDSSATVRFAAQSDGKVGIQTGATVSNALQLGVDDAVKPSTNTWTISSDSRLKEEIEQANLDVCYDAVKNIPLKRYKWKDDVYSEEQVKDRRKIGWIAQDVEAHFPKAVSVSPFEYNQQYDEEGNVISSTKIEDCKSLNADQLYAAMYGAVQKLIQKIEVLEAKVAALETS